MIDKDTGGNAWGVGLGFVLGIILAVLSLTELPFLVRQGLISRVPESAPSDAFTGRIGGSPFAPPRQSLPDVQNREDQAPLEQSQRLADRDGWLKAAQNSAAVAAAPSVPASSPVPSRIGAVTTNRTGRLVPPPVDVPPAPSSSAPSSAAATSRNPLANDEAQTLLKHARFLIKAGLAPMAKDPLRQVVREAPGTPLAQEAQQTLDSLSRN